jgi:organic hydroperoxide reductase OsmC/OhrA
MTWTGNRGTGTSGYRDYGRDHEIAADGRPAIEGSSDPVFRGDKTRWNPELELVAALSQCHMLSYLHVCVTAGIVVTAYDDAPSGLMAETEDGGGHFTEVVLRPRVTVADAAMAEKAMTLHEDASEKCFIASSVNFPVRHEPSVTVQKLLLRTDAASSPQRALTRRRRGIGPSRRHFEPGRDGRSSAMSSPATLRTRPSISPTRSP